MSRSNKAVAKKAASACWAHDAQFLNELIWALERAVMPKDKDGYTKDEMEKYILERLNENYPEGKKD